MPGEEISCNRNEEIDLAKIFSNLRKNVSHTQRHYKTFYLENTWIKVLPSNMFSDFTFEGLTLSIAQIRPRSIEMLSPQQT